MVNLKLKGKLLASGITVLVVPILILLLVMLWQINSIQKIAADESIRLAKTDLDHISQGVTSMLTTQHQLQRKYIEAGLNLTKDVIRKSGGVSLDARATIGWDAKNQLTGEIKKVGLQRIIIGGRVITQNTGFSEETPVVDQVKKLVGGTCTIFQRMNESGDMLRVATNVANKENQRAIGTYVAAVNTDGTRNPVIASVMDGRRYMGRAFVVDAWYAAAYEPFRDGQGKIAGMLYYGVKEEEGASDVRRSIMDIKVGTTGYVYVLDSKGNYVISKDGKRDGENIWDSKDADGKRFIQDIVNAALRLGPNQIGETYYQWKNAGDAKARPKIVHFSYFAPWDWIIGVGVL
ncbi:MAG: Cache 3/Cache 2 fusion domain-containing protein [Fibrobacterota bacterium]